MADNRIRLKQIYTPELSGFILSVSSGEQGATGPTGPAGTGLAPSGVDKAVQYRNGDQWGGSTIYYDNNNQNLGIGDTAPLGKLSFGDYSNADNSTPTVYFHESGAGQEYGVNFDESNLNYFVSTGANHKHSFGSLSHLNAFTEHFSVANDGEVTVPAGRLNVSAGSGILSHGAIIGSGYADLPTGSNFPGTEGEIAWGSGHFYLCTGSNLWGRVAITGF